MKDKVLLKREKEKKLILKMIMLYCKKNHHETEIPCIECKQLIEYAFKRIDKCPFMETKTFCSKCKVHCYNKKMQTLIKEVMRYSGPRMLIYHPIIVMRHFIESVRSR